MATFGKKGDEVHHINGLRGYILNNRIRASNSISVMADRRRLRWNIKNITLNKKVTTDSSDWSFHAVLKTDIDWDLIQSEITSAKPLLLVEVQYKKKKERLIMVHKSLLHKADILKIKMPGKVFKDKPAYKLKVEISEWVDWAKKVKTAKWPKGLTKKAKVSVTYLSV